MRTETRTEERVVLSTHTIYIADDGTEFESEQVCRNYEHDKKEEELEKLISRFKISKLDGVLPVTNGDEWRDCDAVWYKINDDEEYELIESYYELLHGSDIYFHEPGSYPTIACMCDYDGYTDGYYLSEIIDQVKSFFNRFDMSVTIKERK